jgi:hypothetical protein
MTARMPIVVTGGAFPALSAARLGKARFDVRVVHGDLTEAEVVEALEGRPPAHGIALSAALPG